MNFLQNRDFLNTLNSINKEYAESNRAAQEKLAKSMVDESIVEDVPEETPIDAEPETSSSAIVDKWNDAFAAGNAKYGKYSFGTMRERLEGNDDDGGEAFLGCLQDAFAGVHQVMDKNRKNDYVNFKFDSGTGFGEQDRWFYAETDKIPVEGHQHDFFQYQVLISFGYETTSPWRFSALKDGIPLEDMDEEGNLGGEIEISRRGYHTDNAYTPIDNGTFGFILHPRFLFEDISVLELLIDSAIRRDMKESASALHSDEVSDEVSDESIPFSKKGGALDGVKDIHEAYKKICEKKPCDKNSPCHKFVGKHEKSCLKEAYDDALETKTIFQNSNIIIEQDKFGGLTCRLHKPGWNGPDMNAMVAAVVISKSPFADDEKLRAIKVSKDDVEEKSDIKLYSDLFYWLMGGNRVWLKGVEIDPILTRSYEDRNDYGVSGGMFRDGFDGDSTDTYLTNSEIEPDIREFAKKCSSCRTMGELIDAAEEFEDGPFGDVFSTIESIACDNMWPDEHSLAEVLAKETGKDADVRIENNRLIITAPAESETKISEIVESEPFYFSFETKAETEDGVEFKFSPNWDGDGTTGPGAKNESAGGKEKTKKCRGKVLRITESTGNFQSSDGEFPIVAYRYDGDGSEEFVADSYEMTVQDAKKMIEDSDYNENFYDISIESGYYDGIQAVVKFKDDREVLEDIVDEKSDPFYVTNGISEFAKAIKFGNPGVGFSPSELVEDAEYTDEQEKTIDDIVERVMKEHELGEGDIDSITEDFFTDEDKKAIGDIIKEGAKQIIAGSDAKVSELLNRLCSELGFKKYGVSARFSNGETWYNEIHEKSADESVGSAIRKGIAAAAIGAGAMFGGKAMSNGSNSSEPADSEPAQTERGDLKSFEKSIAPAIANAKKAREAKEAKEDLARCKKFIEQVNATKSWPATINNFTLSKEQADDFMKEANNHIQKDNKIISEFSKNS
jgi:hypothetical protein